jgi:hypothetical protein
VTHSMAGDRLDALGVEPLDPTVDRAAAAEQQRGDGDPGMAVAEEQEEVRAESDLGIGGAAVEVEEGGALLRGQVEAAFHGVPRGCQM